MELNELLAMTDQLLAQKREYFSPPKKYVYFSYLSTNEPKETFIHNYNPKEVFPSPESPVAFNTIIIHGHKRGEPCATPYFCHEQGYKPSNENTPAFRKQFKLKWRSLYEG